MANMFNESLQKALAGHDKEMSNQFAEIKELLAGKKSASPATKRAKQNGRNQEDGDL